MRSMLIEELNNSRLHYTYTFNSVSKPGKKEIIPHGIDTWFY